MRRKMPINVSETNVKQLQARKLKVCPVVLRSGNLGLEILMFRHPLAGVQLVNPSSG